MTSTPPSELERLTALQAAFTYARKHDPKYARSYALGCLADPHFAAQLLSDVEPHLILPAAIAIIHELRQVSASNIRIKAQELKSMERGLEQELIRTEEDPSLPLGPLLSYETAQELMPDSFNLTMAAVIYKNFNNIPESLMAPVLTRIKIFSLDSIYRALRDFIYHNHHQASDLEGALDLVKDLYPDIEIAPEEWVESLGHVPAKILRAAITEHHRYSYSPPTSSDIKMVIDRITGLRKTRRIIYDL